jgi:hypothetical protein
MQERDDIRFRYNKAKSIQKDGGFPLEMKGFLEEAAEESLLPLGSWLSIFAQADKALELLHYLYGQNNGKYQF